MLDGYVHSMSRFSSCVVQNGLVFFYDVFVSAFAFIFVFVFVLEFVSAHAL